MTLSNSEGMKLLSEFVEAYGSELRNFIDRRYAVEDPDQAVKEIQENLDKLKDGFSLSGGY